MRPFERLVKRYGAAAAFIAAATPIPDDLVYIPLGLAKYNPKRFFLATFAGKVVLSYVVVVGSYFFGDTFRPFLEQIEYPTPIYIWIVAFWFLLTVTVILMLRLDCAIILGKAAPFTLEDYYISQESTIYIVTNLNNNKLVEWYKNYF